MGPKGEAIDRNYLPLRGEIVGLRKRAVVSTGVALVLTLVIGMGGCVPNLGDECKVDRDCPATKYCAEEEYCIPRSDAGKPSHDGTTPDEDARSDSTIPQDAGDGTVDPDVHQDDALPPDGGEGGSDGMVHPTDATPPADATPPDGGEGGSDGTVHPTDATPPADATPPDGGQGGSDGTVHPTDAMPPADAAEPIDAHEGIDGCTNPELHRPEICDALDNDCDGQTDEDFRNLGQPCALEHGVCRAEGIYVCTDNGLAVRCNAQPGNPGDEVCNGLDDDCDGDIDEDFQGDVLQCGVGACAHSVTICDDGNSVDCDPLEGAQAEVCNGIDDDCDGQTDEGVKNTCNGCGPVPIEICDGLDNNCDGQTDEGDVCPEQLDTSVPNDAALPSDAGVSDDAQLPPLDATSPADATICVPAIEICDGMDNDCDGQVDEGVQNACGTCGEVPVEICDGLDNDCDGETDEESSVACECPLQPLMQYTRTCLGGVLQPCPCVGQEFCNGLDDDNNGHIDDVVGVGLSCASGVGECRRDGTQECDVPSGALVCNAPVAEPIIEICDGLDNNCDGQIDEGVQNACGTCEVIVESCNGIDDDCNGAVDDVPSQECTTGIGTCERAGTLVCGELGPVCNAEPGLPTAELCDSLDNDCDGEIDEVCPDFVDIPAGGVIDTAGVLRQIPAFALARTETTVAQYRVCVEVGSCPAPPSGGTYTWNAPGKDGYAINGVTWVQADNFCRWAHARLPTVNEWIRGSRSDTQTIYSWGDELPDCDHAQLSNCLPNGVALAGSHHAGASPFGLEDMQGNVLEWSADASGDTRHWSLGGAYDNGPAERYVRTATPFPNGPNNFVGPSYGFRCAR